MVYAAVDFDSRTARPVHITVVDDGKFKSEMVAIVKCEVARRLTGRINAFRDDAPRSAEGDGKRT